MNPLVSVIMPSYNAFLLKHRIHANQETKRNLTEWKEEREKAYAQFQRDSLYASGFRLDEAQLRFLNTALVEYDGRCDSEKGGGIIVI